MRILLLVIFVLSGCAPSYKKVTLVDDNRGLPESQGVLILNVINNKDRLSATMPNWTHVRLVRMDNLAGLMKKAREKAQKSKSKKLRFIPDMYRISALENSNGNGMLFAGKVPQGKYMLLSLESIYHTGNGVFRRYFPVLRSFSSFDINDSRITDLGSVLFQPIDKTEAYDIWNASYRARAAIASIPEETQNIPRFERAYPNLMDRLKNKETLTWSDHDLTPFHADIIRHAESAPYNYDAFRIQEGELIAAKLGKVYVRGKEKKWVGLQLPEATSINAVSQYRDKTLLLGDRGLLFSYEALGNQISTFLKRKNNENFLALMKLKKQYLVAIEEADDYLIYLTRDLNAEWRQIGRFDNMSVNPLWGGFFPIITQQGELRVFTKGKRYDFDSASAKWTSVTSRRFMRMRRAKSGHLLGMTSNHAYGIGNQVISHDDGKTWIDIDRKTSSKDRSGDLSVPTLTLKGRVISFSRIKEKRKPPKMYSFHLSNFTKVKDTLHLVSTSLSTNDIDTEDWQIHGVARPDCLRSLPALSNDNELYFSCDLGQVVKTRDLGQHWENVFDIDRDGLLSTYHALLEHVSRTIPEIDEYELDTFIYKYWR